MAGMIPTARIGRAPFYRACSPSTGIVPATPLPISASCLDDAMFEEIMQMHNSNNSLGVVRDDERRNGITFHHLNRLGCQFIRSDQLWPMRGQGTGSDLGKISTLLEKPPHVTVGNDP